MRTIRVASGYAALWLLVVAVASSFAWTAIRQAGTETALVAGGSMRVQAPVGGVLPNSSGTGTATAPATATAPTPNPTASPATAPMSGGHPSGIPTASGPGRTAPGSAGPAPRPGTAPAPSPAPSPAPAPAPATIEGSLVTRGGTVAVACTGNRLIFRSARPQDGWRLDGPSTEGGSLRVSFKAGGDGGDEVHVSATCVGGRPQVVERPDEHGD